MTISGLFFWTVNFPLTRVHGCVELAEIYRFVSPACRLDGLLLVTSYSWPTTSVGAAKIKVQVMSGVSLGDIWNCARPLFDGRKSAGPSSVNCRRPLPTKSPGEEYKSA